MEAEENAQVPAAAGSDRRDDSRIAVDEEAALLVLSRGARLACRIVEISLSGCRMRTRDRYTAGCRIRMEASFKLRGVAFRLNAETEWTDGKYLAGLRFVDVAPRRVDELVEVLAELAAEQAARAVKEAAERLAAEAKMQKEPAKNPNQPSSSALPAPVPDSSLAATPKPPELAARKDPGPAVSPAPARTAPLGPLDAHPQQAALQPAPANGSSARSRDRERRGQSRHEVDTSATILLVNIASRLPGRILNLSMGGCRIRTEEKFPVGIYTRVETEFHLEGMPFRLGGVVQTIQDRNHVGIRFLDMSERKREQVAQLIEEIEELKAEQAGGEL
jgi:c-di-GMP-binding flagellar brake protein YcgR